MTQAPQHDGGRRASLDRVERALGEMGLSTHSHRGRSFMAQCPVHAEKTGSLSVTWSDDANGGKVLLYCHGCQASTQELAEAMGLSLGDLFDEPLPPKYEPTRQQGRSYRQRQSGQRRGKLGKLPKPIVPPHRDEDTADEHEHHWKQTNTYPYFDAQGLQVEEVIREECEAGERRHKQFRQVFLVDGRRRKTKPEGFTPVLYRHPQLLEAIANGEPVYLLEGEKDVETAEAMGLVATTNAQGGRSFPPELAEVFTDADVRVVLDRDDAGWDRGVFLHELLSPLAQRVLLLLPATTAEKSDFTDHVEAGHELADLQEVKVSEVAAWSTLAKLRKKHQGVETALAESLAQQAAATDVAATGKAPVKAEEHKRFGKRWAQETEIRCEALVEQLGELRDLVNQNPTEWAKAALAEGEEVRRQALTAARTAHHTVGLVIPPLLQDTATVPPAPDEEPMSDELAATIAAANGQQSGRWQQLGGDELRAGVSIDQPEFRIVNGQIVMVDRNSRRKRNDNWDEEDDENLKLVLGLDVRIVEMEYLEEDHAEDDVDTPELLGRDSRKEQAKVTPAAPAVLAAVVISFTHPDSREQMLLRVKADDWHSGVWLDSLPGQPDYDAKPSGIALIKRAVKAVSENIKMVERYRWTGWRRTDEGKWMFVHAGGAIGADGALPAPVLLTGPLARYDLPDPTTDAATLRAAFLEGSASFLHKMPNRVAVPLLGHTYRSAMGVNPWVLLLVGSPGSYKTSVASLAMHHWGELWDRRKPATSMSGNGSTLNALRIQLNRAKDALFWADDVAPTKDWGLAQKTLEEFARLVHNAEERTRAERDGQGVLDGTVPRASAMITSEVMPRPGSGAQRMLVVNLRKEEMNLQNLIDLDQIGPRHQRALLMSSFLQWLAGDIEQIRIRLRAEVGLYAEALRESGETDRQAEAAANTWGGWLYMTRFLVDAGAITEEEQQRLLERADEGIKEALKAAVDPDMPTRLGARVRELLAHALRSGVAYVDDVRTGECPEWPLGGRLGWRRTNMGGDEIHGPKYRYDARGIKLGWVLNEVPDQGERCKQLYIESTAALEQVIQTVAKSMTDAPQLDRGTAVRALYDEGILIAEERDGKTPRFTMQRSVPCEQRRQRVTVLRLDELLGNWDERDDVPLPEGDGPDGGGSNGGGPSGGPGAPEGPAGGAGGAESVGDVWDDLFRTHDTAATASVDVFSQSSLVSTQTNSQDLTSPDPTENHVSTTWEDLEGRTATMGSATSAGPCIICGVNCSAAFLGYRIHVLCFRNSTEASRAAAASRGTATQPVAAVAAPTPTEQPEQPIETAQPVPTPTPAAPVAAAAPSSSTSTRPNPATGTRGRSRATERIEAADEKFAGPAAVLDVDAIWMPDGTRHDRPAGISHVGHVAELVDRLHLGTQVTARRAWPGQVWITPAALEAFGIPVGGEDLPDDTRERGEALRRLTKGTAFITDAIASGWQLGGAGDSLATWTRVWRTDSDRRGVWVTLMPGMDDPAWPADARMPILRDNPDHSTLVRRLSLFAGALHAPFTMSASTTGLDLMVDLRAKDRERMFTVVENLPWAATLSTTEADLNWSRKPTAEEAELTYIHAYDRGGSYAAGIAGLELPIGEPVHHPEGSAIAFDKKTPGYWRILVPEAGDWRMPHPLNPRGRLPEQPIWITTPGLEFAIEQEYNPEILEAYTWPEHGRVLDPWYDRVRDARTALDTEDPDAQAARNQLKALYTFTIGMLGSETHMKGRREYAPHRRHHIIAKARTNILRRVAQIGNDVDVWPVAVSKDTILYVSNEADPIKAWPGDPKQLGRGFGQYKPEASGLLADQLEFLNGFDYRGMKALKGADYVDDGLAD